PQSASSLIKGSNPHSDLETTTMKARFVVTYEIITPESAADSDAAERGFVGPDGRPADDRALVTLREALAIAGSYPDDAGAYRWFSSYPETDYRTGAETI